MQKSFVRYALAGALTVLLGSIPSANAQEIELRVSHFLPPNHTFQKAMVAWGELLEKESKGRLKLRIYPAGQLGGPANRQFDAARNGITDIAIGLHGATPNRYQMTELVSLPFAGPSLGATSAIMSRRLTELAPTYLAKEHEGIRILWMAVTPRLMFHSKASITKVEDFKGLRVRYAGIQFKNIIDSLGASPLLVPPQEAQDSLSKGIIDAATFPYEGAASFGLGTVAKFSLEPGVAAATFAVVMNPAKYDALPADLKALIDKTTGAAAAEAFGKMLDEAEIHGKSDLISKGVTVNVLNDDELSKLKKILAPQVEAAIGEVEKKDSAARKFFQEFSK